jgi:hypothetical protein
MNSVIAAALKVSAGADGRVARPHTSFLGDAAVFEVGLGRLLKEVVHGTE